jgi:ribosomal protein S18 acetylase RimI-like enzyme
MAVLLVESGLAIRDAGDADHNALMELEGSDRASGAALIQARTDFFSRSGAYPNARVLVAEAEGGKILGVLMVALNDVYVSGQPCHSGYICNVRVQADLQRRGIGPILMRTATQWLEDEGARYVTGLIKTTNAPSLKMVERLGWQRIARFDYLVLELTRFRPAYQARMGRVVLREHATEAPQGLFSSVLQHFVPRNLSDELFAASPAGGGYSGTLEAICANGWARVSIWDDRIRRGLDRRRFPFVKAYEVSFGGQGGFDGFLAIAERLHRYGLAYLMLPVPVESPAAEELHRYAESHVDFHFVGRPLNGAAAVPRGQIYFDVRH